MLTVMDYLHKLLPARFSMSFDDMINDYNNITIMNINVNIKN